MKRKMMKTILLTVIMIGLLTSLCYADVVVSPIYDGFFIISFVFRIIIIGALIIVPIALSVNALIKIQNKKDQEQKNEESKKDDIK